MKNILNKKKSNNAKKKKKREKSLQMSFKDGSCHVMTVLNKQKRN